MSSCIALGLGSRPRPTSHCSSHRASNTGCPHSRRRSHRTAGAHAERNDSPRQRGFRQSKTVPFSIPDQGELLTHVKELKPRVAQSRCCLPRRSVPHCAPSNHRSPASTPALLNPTPFKARQSVTLHAEQPLSRTGVECLLTSPLEAISKPGASALRLIELAETRLRPVLLARF